MGTCSPGDCETAIGGFCERVWGPAVTGYPLQGRGYSIQCSPQVPFLGLQKWHWRRSRHDRRLLEGGPGTVLRALRAIFAALLQQIWQVLFIYIT